MTTPTITTEMGKVYQLEWTTPDVSVTNVFIDPNGTPQEFPDPAGAPSSAPRYEIRVSRGPTEAAAQPDRFRKNRTPPTVVQGKPKAGSKTFSARFLARDAGVYVFTITDPQGKEIKQVMLVHGKYRTIADVLAHPTAVRRHAVLTQVAKIFPAFNTWAADPTHAAKGLTVGTDSGALGQGVWKPSYEFDGDVKDTAKNLPNPPAKLPPQPTSCTTINPSVMASSAPNLPTKNNTSRWAFNAGPHQVKVNGTANPGWIEAEDGRLPNVGDTYIVFNGHKETYGHVGIILHVPEDGNGLWITADGGQGGLPTQIALLVPRWGLRGADLPKNPPGYTKMTPDPKRSVYLSGGKPIAIHKGMAMGGTDGDVAKITAKIKFKAAAAPAKTSNPRCLHGFVDIESQNLSFPNIDTQHKVAPTTMETACKELQKMVDAVIEAAEKGEVSPY